LGNCNTNIERNKYDLTRDTPCRVPSHEKYDLAKVKFPHTDLYKL